MISIQRPVLVFGATGQQGGSVARALLRARWPVRAFVRDPAAQAAVALRDAGAELVRGSLTDFEAIRVAMKGVHGIFSVLPGNLHEDEEVRLGGAIADLAAESGASHLVYSSGASVGETPTGVARFDAKWHIEAHIRTLPITATIIRPVIFMEMLVRPGFGLDEDRFTFFLRPDQAMQLIPVEDIGKFAAAIFSDKARFAGQTFKIASDTVTGRELGAAFSEAAGRPIRYRRFTAAELAAVPGFAQLAESLESGPLSDHVNLEAMRAISPHLLSFRSWLNGSGRDALEKVTNGAAR